MQLRDGNYASRNVGRHAELRYDHASGLLVQTYGPQYQLFVIGTNMVFRLCCRDGAGAGLRQ